ncbi:MAG: ATP-binding protein [Ignavibacteriaceae bacterium]
MSKKNMLDKFKEYHFEFKHITIIFIVLFSFQFLVSFINKASIKNFFGSTQEWYQKDSAEKIANLTTTSLELQLESVNQRDPVKDADTRRIIKSFNIILTQPVLQNNIQDICVIVQQGKNILAIDDGKNLYSFLFNNSYITPDTINSHAEAIKLYNGFQNELRASEQIKSIVTEGKTFNTFVPFILKGEYVGAVYIKNTPDFSFLTSQIISNYDETSLIYLSFISLGLLAMYFVSSYTLRERDEAQKLLFNEHEENLKKQITYEKELVFTKRIYHTHHKAEKVMGFIKGDLRLLSPENINEIKFRVTKYANFISRIIYDMKWYEPPVQTIRNPIFKTDLNEVINFIVNHIFLRTSRKTSIYNVKLQLDENIPKIGVNEFVIWEIIEPLIQNSIDHAGIPDILINVKTGYDPDTKISTVKISDNGKGVDADLLKLNEEGIKRIFEENVSTKQTGIQNTGYGCYIAYEITKRCGWQIDVRNLPECGCEFIITINH